VLEDRQFVLVDRLEFRGFLEQGWDHAGPRSHGFPLDGVDAGAGEKGFGKTGFTYRGMGVLEGWTLGGALRGMAGFIGVRAGKAPG